MHQEKIPFNFAHASWLLVLALPLLFNTGADKPLLEKEGINILFRPGLNFFWGLQLVKGVSDHRVF